MEFEDSLRADYNQMWQRKDLFSLHITEIEVGDLGDIITIKPENDDQEETLRPGPAGLIYFMISK